MQAQASVALWRGLVRASLFALLLAPVNLRGDDLSRQLNQQYTNKVLLLKNFYGGSKLRFDSNGQVLGSVQAGDWTTDGVVEIRRVRISKQNIQFKGNRVYVLAHSQDGLSLIPSDRALRIDIELAASSRAPSAIDSALSNVFLTARDRFSDFVPEYWKPCVTIALSDVSDETYRGCHFQGDLAVLVRAGSYAKDDPGIAAARRGSLTALILSDFDQKLKVRAGVNPPKLLTHHEPEFSDAARKVRAQGTVTLSLVVDNSGFPQNIRVARPLGCGLDVQAVKTVKEWRFKPAEKDGQPVAAEIAIEVDFHLY